MEGVKYNQLYKNVKKALKLCLKYTMSLLIGLLLSRVGVKFDISPFSLSLFSIVPITGMVPLPYFIGSFIGFITKDFAIENFKYIISNTVLYLIILISSTHYIKKVYSPVLPAIICLVIGFIFMFANNVTLFSVLLLVCESILCGCISYFLNHLIVSIKKESKFELKDIVCLNITLVLFLCAIDSIYFYGISLSFVICIVFLLLSAYIFNYKISVLFNMSLCATVALLHISNNIFFVMLYLPSLIAIMLGKFEKKHIPTSYFITYILLYTVNIFNINNISFALIPLISILIYIAIPKIKFANFIDKYITVQTNEPIQSSEILCKKFNDVSSELLNAIDTEYIRPIFKANFENKIKRFLKQKDCYNIDITNYYNDNKQSIALNFKCEQYISLEELRLKLCSICNHDFIYSQKEIDKTKYYLLLEACERFKIECYAIYKAKNGQTVCGDNVSAFKTNNENYNLLLADGMGCGKEAYNKSHDTILLLKKLLKSNITAHEALQTVNCALGIIKDGVGFSTIDLCEVSLVNGIAEFYKCGAYCSYILNENKITVINGGGYPAGLFDNISYSKNIVELKHNDVIIMMSDGVSNITDEIKTFLLTMSDTNIESISKNIINIATKQQNESSDDDITVLTIKVCDRLFE